MTERFKSPCPPPTPFEAELLHKLIEECSEVQQRATKALRFGLDEVQPGQDKNNRERLEDEMLDLQAIRAMCLRARLLKDDSTHEEFMARLDRIRKYMQNDPPAGVRF